jgi:hypothetical protein
LDFGFSFGRIPIVGFHKNLDKAINDRITVFTGVDQTGFNETV